MRLQPQGAKVACACTRSNLLLALSDNRNDSGPDAASDSDATVSLYAADATARFGALSVVSDSGQQLRWEGSEEPVDSAAQAVAQTIIIHDHRDPDRDRDRSRAY